MHSGIMIYEDGTIVNFGYVASSKKMVVAMQDAMLQFEKLEKDNAIALLTPAELERALTEALMKQQEADKTE